MNSLYAIVLMLSLLPMQEVITARRRAPSGGGTCTGLTSSDQWPAFAPGNTCGGGGACTNGAALDTQADVVGSHPATQGTNGLRPIFTTGVLNSLPGLAFNGATSSRNLTLAPTTISPATGGFTIGAVIKPNSCSGGTSFIGGTPGAPEFRCGSGVLEFLNGGVASLCSGSATISTSTYTAVKVTYNATTGACSLFICTGGTCTVDGTPATVTTSFSAPIEFIGTGNGSDWFDGTWVDGFYWNSIGSDGWGAYVHGCYNL